MAHEAMQSVMGTLNQVCIHKSGSGLYVICIGDVGFGINQERYFSILWYCFRQLYRVIYLTAETVLTAMHRSREKHLLGYKDLEKVDTNTSNMFQKWLVSRLKVNKAWT